MISLQKMQNRMILDLKYTSKFTKQIKQDIAKYNEAIATEMSANEVIINFNGR